MFFEAAFGATCDEFLEISAMPDRYIFYRRRFESEADGWRSQYRKLSLAEQAEFLTVLERLHKARRRNINDTDPKYRALLHHYYPKQ